MSCIQCIPGFYLSISATNGLGVCMNCGPGCFYCSSSSPNTCTACFAGAYLTNTNTCQSCASNCITCQTNNPSICTSCQTGFYLTVSGTCSSISSVSSANTNCGQNCGTCVEPSSGATPICTNCVPGYVLQSGFCVQCPGACSICSLNQNTFTNNQPTCTACNIGYFLNKQSLTCQACQKGCGACFNSTICLTCFSGYSLTSTYTCQVRCIYPCATCSSTNPSQCTSCVNGFTFNSNSLQNCVSNVNSCNTAGNCVVCPFGYGIQIEGTSQTCVECNAGTSCSRCNAASKTVCTSCAYGTYLSNGISKPCATGCTNCLNADSCLRCGVGYVATLPATMVTGASTDPLLQEITDTNNIIYQIVNCAACASPCVTCISNPTSCTSCVSGYTLMGTTCVSNFNFGTNIMFDTNPGSFVQNYYNLLVQSSNSVSQTVSTIFVNSIIYGSANISFSISTPNAYGSSAATTQQINLNNFLKSSTIAGMTVLKANLVLNGAPSNNNSDSSSTSNTTLIIAIVVPIAALSSSLFI